jgi:NAD(P)-dependent dehydrogenase (short-subunit alcohol dehydrogenase family)
MGEKHGRPTALVTGAAVRLGRAIALDLAQHGWQIGVHYHRSAAAAEALVGEIERLGSKAVALKADLTREDELRRLVPSCAEQLGAPTCLINNAARFETDGIETLDWVGWQAELDVNLRAPVWRLTPEEFSYTIAKSALWTATQTLAQALAPRIRVNAIGPGPVLPNRRQSEAEFERECRATMLGRAATMEEICSAVRFLLDAPSVTGQMIALDSGQHLLWRPGEGTKS